MAHRLHRRRRILRQTDSVKDTATVASLWATGAIGMAVGPGSYDVAVVLSLITLPTWWALSPLKPELVKEPEGEETRETRADRDSR